MKILITNDDGISAEGLVVLAETLQQHHTVYVIAPDEERSACSNALTIRHHLKVTKHEKKGWFSINGFPADCVNIGLHGGLIEPVDCVVSGINHGLNVGDDIFFSGTVAGARTAFIFGVNAIALSLDSFHRPSANLENAARFALSCLDELDRISHEKPYFYNINIPDLATSFEPYIYTHIGHRKYIDSYVREERDPDTILMKLAGRSESVHDPLSDITVVESGRVSVTPMMTDTTNYSLLERLRHDT